MSPKAPMLCMLLMLSGAAQAQDASPSSPPGAAAPTPQRDPQAIATLERMGAYLRTLTKFRLKGDSTTEEVLDTGQKVQYPGTIDLLVERPNKLRANLYSTQKRREFYYDGRSLTVFAPRQGFYAVVAAPPTIGEVAKAMNDRLGIVVPLSDLFLMGSDPALTARIKGAFFVATEVVDDQVCDHFAFRNDQVDWQLWIREGAEPLPVRWIITAAKEAGQPSYQVSVTWDLKPTVPATAFAFVPPAGADRIQIANVPK